MIKSKYFFIIYYAIGAFLLALLFSDWLAVNYRWQKEGLELFLFIIFYSVSGYLSEKFLRFDKRKKSQSE